MTFLKDIKDSTSRIVHQGYNYTLESMNFFKEIQTCIFLVFLKAINMEF